MKSPPRQCAIRRKSALSMSTLVVAAWLVSVEGHAAASRDSILRVIERAPASAPGQWRVKFQDRGARPSYVERMGAASVDGVVNVDCLTRRFQLEALVLYAEPTASEPVTRLGRRDEWRAADDDTLLGRVVSTACAPGRGPVLVATAAALKEGAMASAARGAERAPVSTSSSALASEPSSSGPSSSFDRADLAVRLQLGAFGSEQQASQRWREIEASDGVDLTGLAHDVEQAVVGGKTYYRLLLKGFVSRQKAVVLCRRLNVVGSACFLRG